MSTSDKSDSVRDDAMKVFLLGAEVSLELATAAMRKVGEGAARLTETLEALAESVKDQQIPPPPEPPTGPYPPPPPNDHGVTPGIPIL